MGKRVVVTLACLLYACASPDVTHCGDYDCPKGEACDGRGGCVSPEQVTSCQGMPDNSLCTYTDSQDHVINGACTGGVCNAIICGNGIVQPGEVCDDGNNVSGDGCSADCKSNEMCGNGVVDASNGEQCDLGTQNMNGGQCEANCTLPRCGNAIVDPTLNEECDSGMLNADTPDAPCRTYCQLPRCGDGIVDTGRGEVCDDGNNLSGDGCSGDCKSNETCGNGIVDVAAGEVCDPPNPGHGCSADCKSNETCGNHIVDTDVGEVCDDGNTVSGDGCSGDCKSLEVCGNGIVDTGTEQCDLGINNSNAPDAPCRTNCMLQRCGDTIIDPQHGEQCDDGAMNMNLPDYCRTNCELPRCGDTIVDTAHGEVCDDGNTASGDGCSADCRSNETCGNGYLDSIKGEQCDNGANNSNLPDATCRTNCLRQKCGDAIVDDLFGELCDLGASNSNLPNMTCRTNCLPQRCGDGVLDNTKGEVCDDGNVVSGDGCSADCKSNETCGNGYVDTIKGEQCDKGSANSNSPNAACRTNCQSQKCGDAIVDNLLGEICDLGASNSNSPNASCRTNCLPQRCGDGIVDTTKGEVCDDGNNVSGDGCSADCKSTEVCGNSIVDTIKGEQCDAGANNSNAPNAPCRLNCQLPKCGDAITDTALGELCDAGASNSNLPNATCRTNCQPQRCGDTILDNLKGEVCDDGNNTSGDGCSADCKSNETCGNGIIDTIKGEICDNGGSNSNLPNMTCRTNCTPQKCGDGIIDTAFGEQCDAGASNSNLPNASCRTTCLPQRCGDGIVDTSFGEVCDDGNNVSGDGCSADCKSNETCGNNIVDTAKGEQCDKGALDSNAPNAPCRLNCQLPKCGDGIIDTSLGELCDNGASNSNLPNATCRTTCLPQRCGDGIVDNLLGEVCDDGNTISGDGCSSDCKSNETCGNGIVDTVKGEQCDDGNTRPHDGCSVCKLESAIALQPGAAPTGSENAVIVYDGARQRTVMFGGWAPNGNLGDTYEWDGVSWTKMHTKHSPSPRFDAGGAYDAVRHRVVIFGGYDVNYGGTENETWEYDGVDWTQRFPTTVPSVRAGAAMSFDANLGHVIMFGGATTNVCINCGTSNNTGAPVNETWVWDGTNWTLLNPATKPAARGGARMVFDSAHKYVLMYGGLCAGDGVNCSTPDTHSYSWNGSNWTDLGATTGPLTGFDPVLMAYDANLGKVVAWDGTATYTFEWSGTAWTKITATAPPVRSMPNGTYDAVRKQIVMFGGANTGPIPASVQSDTWVRSGQVWSQVATSFTQPPARYRAGAGYDPLRRRVVVFGGTGSAGSLNDTWEWDGRQWTNPAATTPPPVRGGQFLDYDTSAKIMRLYGGDDGTTFYTDVWTYNGAAWAAQSSAGRTQTGAATMSYDAIANALVTFGGTIVSGSTITAETWTWTAAGGWVKASASTITARTDTATAYDRTRGRTVVFGGTSSNGTLLDTWEWNGSASSWSQVVTSSGPNARTGQRMLYNADAQHVWMFGNSGNAAGEDVWEWNGTAWRQPTLAAGTVPSKYQTSIAYDAGDREMLAFGGRDSGGNPTTGTSIVFYLPNNTPEACTSSQIDYDNDGKAGCLDDECWSVCTPLCPPGSPSSCYTSTPRCGDGTCQSFENSNICPADCPAAAGTCGDFHCDSAETHTSCPNDC